MDQEQNCQDKFEEVASSPNFRFLGNVSVDLPGHLSDHCVVQLESLRRNYHSILLAYGASEDKKLGIPGESTLGGIYSARQFVGWYNGLPDCVDLEPDLQGEEAVIIGQGNVALDVARMLLEDINVLRKTDIAEHALAHLAKSRVKRVHVVGRRGPMQAAFTIKEVHAGIQFDEQRGIVKNDGLGRVTRLVYHDIPLGVDTQQVPGMYCAGWVKRGPTGVIASTMHDAFATGDTIVEDWLSGAAFLDAYQSQNNMGGWDAVKQDIGSAATRAVTWDQWRQIDRAERDRGRAKGKEREKFTNTEDMLSVVG
ncbi:Ferredoxin--NADP(+) reductase [Cladobotryum mycophilum]|uniref:Ferredoxin--NADP(+) reductase n=1 Tax=Cladobotryum mycophilum TaxID=491253 RepID=A0ABR0T143_9HYPO